MTARNTGDGHPDLDATEARSGRPGIPVVWVLVVSTIVALIVVAIVWFMFSSGFQGNGGQSQITDPAQAARTNTPTVSATTPPARSTGETAPNAGAKAGTNAP